MSNGAVGRRHYTIVDDRLCIDGIITSGCYYVLEDQGEAQLFVVKTGVRVPLKVR